MISEKVLNILEYDKIRELIAVHATSEVTKAYFSHMLPADNIDDVKYMQSLQQEITRLFDIYNLNPISQFDDIADINIKCVKGSVLSPSELNKVCNLLHSSRIALHTIQQKEDLILLNDIVASINPLQQLEKEIEICISKDNLVKDEASEKLRSIRRKLMVQNNRLKEKLSSYMHASQSSKYLQDNIVTMRSGRYVIPVKSEFRSAVDGLTHDQSSSGATVFVEPFAVVEMNNALRVLESEEAEEINRILTSLSQSVATYHLSLEKNQEQCTMLDIVVSKYKFGLSCRAQPIIIDKKQCLKINKGRHPLINKDKVVPIDIGITQDKNILVISGPNTGGKTVCLKTVGLFCLMAYSGLYLPCGEESQIPFYEEIFCDLGDRQSIELSLSTFSSHMNNILEILSEANEASLVLLDELGAGTDPTEGSAIAMSVMDRLIALGAKTILTTHYGRIKEYAIQNPKILNSSMQFDEITLQPTYRLLMGYPGTSSAIAIATNLGFDKGIIDGAKAYLDNEKISFETVLAEALRMKNVAEAEVEETKAIRTQIENEYLELQSVRNSMNEKMERINENAKAEVKRLVSKSTYEAEEIIAEMKEKQKEINEASLLDAKKLKNKIDKLNYDIVANENTTPTRKATMSDIVVGNTVFVYSLNGFAKIVAYSEHKKTIKLAVGSMQLEVSLESIAVPILEKKNLATKTSKRRIAEPIQKVEELGEQELKVLGLTVSEATMEIENFIQQVKYNGGKLIKIVHGKGTGALGKGVQLFLRSCQDVKSYRYGGYGEGENGVTIATLK